MQFYGSLQNRMAEGKTYGEIKVGVGVTEMCYTDRHAYEIVEVIDEKHILIRRCKATRIDNNGMSECQEYKYELEPYKETLITEELKADTDRLLLMKCQNPKLYEKVMNGKIGDKIGDNNIKLTLTKNGWKQRYANGKWNCNRFTVGIKEEYFDYSF